MITIPLLAKINESRRGEENGKKKVRAINIVRAARRLTFWARSETMMMSKGKESSLLRQTIDDPFFPRKRGEV